jgi:hypothetical protein
LSDRGAVFVFLHVPAVIFPGFQWGDKEPASKTWKRVLQQLDVEHEVHATLNTNYYYNGQNDRMSEYRWSEDVKPESNAFGSWAVYGCYVPKEGLKSVANCKARFESFCRIGFGYLYYRDGVRSHRGGRFVTRGDNSDDIYPPAWMSYTNRPKDQIQECDDAAAHFLEARMSPNSFTTQDVRRSGGLDAPQLLQLLGKLNIEVNPHRTWPMLCLTNHGEEIVNAVSLYRENMRLEGVDRFGRKCAAEEQRVDLRGPKKTLVYDNYFRLRELSAVDAERILRTHLRDYLDSGDPDPAGPRLRVLKEAVPLREH